MKCILFRERPFDFYGGGGGGAGRFYEKKNSQDRALQKKKIQDRSQEDKTARIQPAAAEKER